MSPSTVGKYFKLSFELIKLNLLTAMSFKASFLTQVIGMIVNDVGLFFIWVIYFQKFPAVNGWTLQDTILLYAITTAIFGIVMTCTRGTYELSKIITTGQLDYFLAFPKNILWHISFSKIEVSAIGDFFFGVSFFLFLTPLSLERILLFILWLIIGSLILFSFILLTQSLTFYFGNFQDAAEELFHSLIGFGLYPQTIYHGLLKIITLTILPAFFIATLPVQSIRDLSYSDLFYAFSFSLTITTIALITFHQGLKRYESGNLINVKM
jgi:ABC-2 type transport system permease protein